MNQEPELRAGIIGLGVGAQHVFGYHEDPRCRVVAACDLDADVLREFAARHPDIRLTAKPEDVLTDPAIHAVSIASYDQDHADQIVCALDHGKHVFAEKPLCRTVDEMRRIRAALRRNPGLRLSTNVVMRQYPRFQWLRSQVRAGRLGEIYYVEGDYDYGRLHKITDGWRGRLRDYSVFLGGAIHLVDLLLWLLRDDVVEAFAWGNRIATRDTPFRADDFVCAMLKFRGGCLAKITANFGCVRPHFHRVAFYGTRATFYNDEPSGKLYTSRERDMQVEPVTEEYPGRSKGALIPSFVASILDHASPEVPERDVFRVLSVCFAVEESKASGQPVKVIYEE